MKDKLKTLDKKKLIIIGIFIISIIIIILGGALLYNKVLYKKSYTEVETIMLNAAKSHYQKNKEKLPQNINDSITITVETLIKNEEMDTITSYTKDKNTTCEGKVNITNINGNYRYTPILNCNDSHQTITLTEYINKNVNIVTEGNGLYNQNNTLVYRGDTIDNYLKLNNKIYRIVKFVDGHPVIILTDISENVEWDNRYNIENDTNSGINDYEVSRIKNYLDNLYNDNSENALLSEDTKLLITRYNLPIGRRCNDDTDKTGKLENAAILTDQYIGLLPVSDFLNASLDKNCTNTTSKSCANYNYLNKYKYTWWTTTANSKNSFKVYTINDIASTSQASNNAYVRPVFYLAKDTIYVSGNGSKNNPFIIK